MEFTFKNLPSKLFSKTNTPKVENPGILWLPPLKNHPITAKIDWLSGLQISSLHFNKTNKWSKELRALIIENNLPLDEQPPFNHSTTLIFTLPEGFRASLGLILTNSNWETRENVYKLYSTACGAFKTDLFIQSLDFWPSPEINNIQWIKV